jgi:hypothetical protein
MNQQQPSSRKPVVFIHTNHKQRLGALVSAHSFKLGSASPDAFDVRLLELADFPALYEAAGKTFLRNGHRRVWDPEDLQSFTPLRFAVPDAMQHRGKALVVDPDVFAVGDVMELFGRDTAGRPIWCRSRAGHNSSPRYLATSVMLLDCAHLPHWDFLANLQALWEHRLDYVDWIELRHERRSGIGLLEAEWNDFDRLTEHTRLLHTTRRRTQPWKTGLRIDYTLRERGFGPVPPSLVVPVLRWWTRNSRYLPHPDTNQEAFFFALLADLHDCGGITSAAIQAEIEAAHVRPDTLELMDRYRGRLWPIGHHGDARATAV